MRGTSGVATTTQPKRGKSQQQPKRKQPKKKTPRQQPPEGGAGDTYASLSSTGAAAGAGESWESYEKRHLSSTDISVLGAKASAAEARRHYARAYYPKSKKR